LKDNSKTNLYPTFKIVGRNKNNPEGCNS